MKMSQSEAIEFILEHGWLTWNPIENVPMMSQFFWDGENKTIGYAWGAALHEIKKRDFLKMQPSLFEAQL